MVMGRPAARQLPDYLAMVKRLWHDAVMQQTLRPLSDAYALAGAGRFAEATVIIEAHAAAGDGEALFTLGDIYWRGIGRPKDPARGRELFRQSSDAGFQIGHHAYTNLLGSGHLGERDWMRALARLEKEAESDARRAQILDLLRAMALDEEGNPPSVPKGEQLSARPYVVLYRGAFTLAECQFLRLVAEPTYERAGIVLSPSQNIPAFMRTADGSSLHFLIEDPAVHAMNRRLAALSGKPVSHGEPLQVLRYRPGQEYRPHYDWLDVGNRRIMTALLYLNDDYEGGETAFTRVGLKVKGRIGDVLVFRSQAPDGHVDELSEHAGLPVISGTKYLGSRWIREAPYVLED